MKKLTNNSNDYAIIVNNGEYGFTVYFGYTVHGEDTCTNRKTYKSERMAVKKANEFLGL